MKAIYEIGLRDTKNGFGNDVLWSSRNVLCKSFNEAKKKADKEVQDLKNKKIIVEVEYIKRLLFVEG
jgi:hypothetical protein